MKNVLIKVIVIAGLIPALEMRAGASQEGVLTNAQTSVGAWLMRRSPCFKYADLKDLRSQYRALWESKVEKNLLPLSIQAFDTNPAREKLYAETLEIIDRNTGAKKPFSLDEESKAKLHTKRTELYREFYNALNKGEILTPEDHDLISVLESYFKEEKYTALEDKNNANIRRRQLETGTGLVVLTTALIAGTIVCVKLIKGKKRHKAEVN